MILFNNPDFENLSFVTEELVSCSASHHLQIRQWSVWQVWARINILNNIAALIENPKWVRNPLKNVCEIYYSIWEGVNSVYLYFIPAAASVPKEVWLSPWPCLSVRLAKLFWVMLQNWRGEELVTGLSFGGTEQACITLTAAGAVGIQGFWYIGIFPKSLINLYGIAFLLVMKCIFWHWLFFSKKRFKWCMKGREVTKLNSKGLRSNNLNYKDQLRSKCNSAGSEIPYCNFYQLLLLVFLILI